MYLHIDLRNALLLPIFIHMERARVGDETFRVLYRNIYSSICRYITYISAVKTQALHKYIKKTAAEKVAAKYDVKHLDT